MLLGKTLSYFKKQMFPIIFKNISNIYLYKYKIYANVFL